MQLRETDGQPDEWMNRQQSDRSGSVHITSGLILGTVKPLYELGAQKCIYTILIKQSFKVQFMQSFYITDYFDLKYLRLR